MDEHTNHQIDEVEDVTQEIYDDTPDTPEERTERIELLKQSMPQKPKKRWPKRLLAIIIVLLVLVGGSVFAYWFGDSKATTTDTSTAKNTSDTPTPEASTTAKAEEFNSLNFGVNLKYPSDWTITDGTQQIIAKSPATILTSGTNASITGQVLITFSQKGKNTLAGFTGDNGAAVLDSEKIMYANPSSAQRAESYISFVQLVPSSTSDALDSIFITGDFGYLKNQLVPKQDIIGNDPLIEVSFMKCTDKSCAHTTKTAVSPDIWSKNINLKKSILNILKSLSLS